MVTSPVDTEALNGLNGMSEGIRERNSVIEAVAQRERRPRGPTKKGVGKGAAPTSDRAISSANERPVFFP